MEAIPAEHEEVRQEVINLRCSGCGHALGETLSVPFRLWGIFRVPPNGQYLAPLQSKFVSRRCRDCGFVNVFELLDGNCG